jgi:putative ubiquitin-RnfH superfamily antitoxin RatB of RatAB toxin-antitoxin module
MASDAGIALTVHVVYAEPGAVWQVALRLPPGTTAGQAVQASGFAGRFPQFLNHTLAIGIFGQACAAERLLSEGDRVEIYRPLTFDPMESRRRRVAHRKAYMTKGLRS